MFLFNMNKDDPYTLEVTGLGDILISPGLLPNRTQDPLWVHRSTGPSGVNALGCALESLWQWASKADETKVNLSVKNGRWRVGRGKLCTFDQSPAPEGSWRRFLPWDERGQEITNATLYIMMDGYAVIVAGNSVVWVSYPEGAGGGGGGGMGV